MSSRQKAIGVILTVIGLISVRSASAASIAPACDPSLLNMSVTPNPGTVGNKMTFSLSGDQGSTWIDDTWSGGVDCANYFWGSKTCNATTSGSFSWTHKWKNCASNDCTITSEQCSKTIPYSVGASSCSISAWPIPCILATGQTSCSSKLTWNANTNVTIYKPNGRVLSTNDSGTNVPVSNITVTPKTYYCRKGESNPTGTVLGSFDVYAVSCAPITMVDESGKNWQWEKGKSYNWHASSPQGLINIMRRKTGTKITSGTITDRIPFITGSYDWNHSSNIPTTAVNGNYSITFKGCLGGNGSPDTCTDGALCQKTQSFSISTPTTLP